MYLEALQSLLTDSVTRVTITNKSNMKTAFRENSEDEINSNCALKGTVNENA